MRHTPLQKYLQECFTYNSITGELFWKEDRPDYHFKDRRGVVMYKRVCAGKLVVGGVRQVNLDNKTYVRARIIWKLAYGVDSLLYIDHIDRNPSNNALINLREVTQAQNMHNRSASKTHGSGLKGARWDKQKKKWFAVGPSVKCVSKWLGFFGTAEEAHKAYCEEAIKNFGEYAAKGL